MVPMRLRWRRYRVLGRLMHLLSHRLLVSFQSVGTFRWLTLEAEDRDFAITGCAGEDWSKIIRCPCNRVH